MSVLPPPAGSGIHAKPNQVMISKSTGATKIRPYSHNQVPKIITVVQKRIVENCGNSFHDSLSHSELPSKSDYIFQNPS